MVQLAARSLLFKDHFFRYTRWQLTSGERQGTFSFLAQTEIPSQRSSIPLPYSSLRAMRACSAGVAFIAWYLFLVSTQASAKQGELLVIPFIPLPSPQTDVLLIQPTLHGMGRAVIRAAGATRTATPSSSSTPSTACPPPPNCQQHPAIPRPPPPARPASATTAPRSSTAPTASLSPTRCGR